MMTGVLRRVRRPWRRSLVGRRCLDRWREQCSGTVESDFLVVGGGPAGCSAAVMARSLELEVVLVEQEAIGSRVRSAPVVENLLGGPWNGVELAISWERHLARSGATVLHDSVVGLRSKGEDPLPWTATLRDNGDIRTQAVVVATGGRDLTLREAVGSGAVDRRFQDTFLWLSSYETILAHDRVVVIGCDRPLLSLVDFGALDGTKPEMVVLALPEMRYVLEAERRELPFGTVHAASVESVRRSHRNWLVTYRLDNGTPGEVACDLVVTNLGAAANIDPFQGLLPLTADGYVDGAALPPGIFVAGDAGHRRHQRVSVAIGEGARAALTFFYSRTGVGDAG